MKEFSNSGYLNMSMLRFTTAGSVDDGKSTLIGRLLFDTKSIFEDQLEQVKQASTQKGTEHMNLALLTDGLKAEREQGITIDVAYRYFATPNRKFIIADTPGHVQYTRNMVTGASTANAAIILVDVRKGITEQTCRHSFIASLLGIQHLMVCINKMDLVQFNESAFNSIKASYIEFAKIIQAKNLHFVPISALFGDNVVSPSPNTPWYNGGTLIELLEKIPIDNYVANSGSRFPVQYVVRPLNNEFHDYRGYAGRIASGAFSVGDTVSVLPAGHQSKISKIDFFEEQLSSAAFPLSVCVSLENELDISRGDMIVKEDKLPKTSNEISLMICWMNEKPLKVGDKYILRQSTREVKAIVKAINYITDVNNLNPFERDHIKMNEIASISIKTTQPLVYDLYTENRITGSLILVNESTFETAGAGMITT